MANIHTVGDRRVLETATDFTWLFRSASGKAPRDESLLDMLRLAFFPQFAFKSVTFALMVLLAAVYSAQLATGHVQNSRVLLQATPERLTAALWVTRSQAVRALGLHRLLLASLIHGDLYALIQSLVLLLVWVSWVERIFGPARTTAIFALGAVASFAICLNIFDDAPIWGPEGGAFALIGASFGFMVFNWQQVRALHTLLAIQLVFFLAPFVAGFIAGSDLRQAACEAVGTLCGLALGFALAPAAGITTPLQDRLRYGGGGVYLLALGLALGFAFVL